MTATVPPCDGKDSWKNYSFSTAASRLRAQKRDKHTVELFDGPAWIETRNELVIENLTWAHEIAARIAEKLPTWFLAEDLQGAVEIALIERAEKYQSYQRIPFRAFAFRRIVGACYDAVRRKEYIERAHYSIDANTETEPIQAEDPGPSPERMCELKEMCFIWQHVAKLPAKHAKVIRLLYREQKTGLEAGKRMGMSESWVSKRHAEALAMLRKMVEAE